jgi:hypothetical protein
LNIAVSSARAFGGGLTGTEGVVEPAGHVAGHIAAGPIAVPVAAGPVERTALDLDRLRT